MTFIGKLLVFLNLIVGIGIAVWSTAVYTQRPAAYGDIPDSVDKGNSPVIFKQMAAEIDAAGKSAAAASAGWGRQLKVLEAAELLRDDRRVKMFGQVNRDGTKAKQGLIDYARGGNKAGGAAFYNLKEDPATRLLNLSPTAADVVKGPNNQPLRPADVLLAEYQRDALAIYGTPDGEGTFTGGLTQDIAALRAEQKRLGADVVTVERQVLAQLVIREDQRNEAAYLAAFEVNVAEQRETVVRRRDQLLRRLSVFDPRK